MYQITKEFHFSASHQLQGLPDEHPCSRVHGHNYVATLKFSATQLDRVGFVVDFRALDPFKKFIDQNLDHQHLNEVVAFNPTSESLSSFLFKIALTMIEDGDIAFDNPSVRLYACSVKETDKTSAEYQAW